MSSSVQREEEEGAAQSKPSVSPHGRHVDAGPPLCRACFKTAETLPVRVRRGGSGSGEPWVESSIRRCANDECWNTTGGTLEERLTHIQNVYGYKYFGDYELSPEQVDAVWEAKAIASLVPELLEAARYALGVLTGNMDGDWDIGGDPVAMLRAAIAKATGAVPPTPADRDQEERLASSNGGK